MQGLILYLVIAFFPKFVGELGKGIMQFCISWAEGGHQAVGLFFFSLL